MADFFFESWSIEWTIFNFSSLQKKMGIRCFYEIFAVVIVILIIVWVLSAIAPTSPDYTVSGDILTFVVNDPSGTGYTVTTDSYDASGKFLAGSDMATPKPENIKIDLKRMKEENPTVKKITFGLTAVAFVNGDWANILYSKTITYIYP